MWAFCQKFRSDVNLQGKTAVITGGNTGIGKETAKDLYGRGARVVLLCRNQEKAKEAVEEIKSEFKNTTGQLSLKKLDLSDLNSVRQCAEEVLKDEDHIHILINNAGIMFSHTLKTKDGIESHLATNHLGHFLLTLLLLPRIITSAPARIINVSSLAHKIPFYGGRIKLEDLNFERRKFTRLEAYSQSKLANVLFTKELDRRLEGAGISNINTYSLHPGIIATELGREYDSFLFGTSWLWKKCSSWLLLTPKQGARTTLYCALEEKLENESGLYYSNCAKQNPHRKALDEETAKALWNASLKLVNMENYNVV